MSDSVQCVSKSLPVLDLPVTYEDAMSLYDLLRSVQYGKGSPSQAYAGLAERIAERLLEVIDQHERGGTKTP